MSMQEHCQERVDYYSSKIRFFPKEPQYYRARAEYYLHLGKNQLFFADIGTYAGILNNQTKFASEYHKLAWRLVSSPQKRIHPEMVLDLAQRAVEMFPDNRDYLGTLGAAYYRSEEWESAIRLLEKNIAQEAPYPEDLFFLSMAYWQIGNIHKANEYYSKAEQWLQNTVVNDIIHKRSLHQFRDEAFELIHANE